MATAKKTPAKKEAPAKKAVPVTKLKPSPDKPPAKKSDKLERHPLSDKYGPKVSDDELKGLGLDMKAHGQHEDIILYEGKVLAGWNRYMACLQQGLKPRTREMEPGGNPVAIAFGTNFVRRRLSSVQKAFFGAAFAVETNTKQADVAKSLGCNLNRLNQSAQLLKAGTPKAEEVIAKIRDNPDMSGSVFDELMIEAGIAKEAPPPAPAPLRTNTHVDDDDGLGDGLDDDDLTGGAIDNLLEDDDQADDDDTPAPRARKEIGEGADPIPAVGSRKPGNTSPTETTPSRLARTFKGMDEMEQRQFVKFAWGKLKAALDAAIINADVAYTAPSEIKPSPNIIGPKPKGKAKKEVADDVLDTKATKASKAAAKKAPAKKAKAKK